MPNLAATEAKLVLYQRDDCHLCEQALAVLAQARVPEFNSVFIDDDLALENRYGHRVPVLHNVATGNELDWPFALPTVCDWLQAQRQ